MPSNIGPVIALIGLCFTFIIAVWKMASAAGKLEKAVEHLARTQQMQAEVLQTHALALKELQVTINYLNNKEKV